MKRLQHCHILMVQTPRILQNGADASAYAKHSNFSLSEAACLWTGFEPHSPIRDASARANLGLLKAAVIGRTLQCTWGEDLALVVDALEGRMRCRITPAYRETPCVRMRSPSAIFPSFSGRMCDKAQESLRGCHAESAGQGALRPDEAEKLRSRRRIKSVVGNKVAVEKVPPDKAGDQ